MTDLKTQRSDGAQVMTKTTDRLAEVQDYFDLCHALIQEAKGAEGDQSYVTNHLDDAENWLDKIEVVTQSLSTDLNKAQQQLKTVLDREAETHSRHDAKMDALEERIAELEKALGTLVKSISGTAAVSPCTAFDAARAALNPGKESGDEG